MRRWLVLILAVGIGMLTAGVSAAVSGHTSARAARWTDLSRLATHQAQLVDDYVSRATSVALLTAQNPAFADFYGLPGSRYDRIAASGPVIERVDNALAYLEKLYPDRIGEACFIDANGAENGRVVRDLAAPVENLSLNEYANPFFGPTFALPAGQVYHAKPYVSPDTNEWVISNSTVVPGIRALVHFEVTIESFRVEAQAGAGGPVLIVDADTGAVVIDTSRPQRAGAALGDPSDGRFTALVHGWAGTGRVTLGGRPAVYQRLADSPTNANHWYAVAVAPSAQGLTSGVGQVPAGLTAASVLFIGYAAALLRRRQRQLLAQANTDPLTGLPNRRRLAADLDATLARATAARPAVLSLLDLNGFKAYNDTFGHPAGDALLARLGAALARSVPDARAYRIGGDEFCILADAGPDGGLMVVSAASAALSEHGDGFAITTAHGTILLPQEADRPDAAMRLVDMRMYEQKSSGRIPADTQTTNALLRALHERGPGLTRRLRHTADLAAAICRRLALQPAEEARIGQAARLHDIGKVAIPDAILLKPGPLDRSEWEFVRQTPSIGERIALAAPSLATLAPLIRAARERFDGTGYPDGRVGEQIPLGARIIAACSAYAAMTADRPYESARPAEFAIAELRRESGAGFDPAVVEALAQVVAAVPVG